MNDIAGVASSTKQPYVMNFENDGGDFRSDLAEFVQTGLTSYGTDEARMLKAILSDAYRLKSVAPVDIGSLLSLCFQGICNASSREPTVKSPRWRFSAGKSYELQCPPTASTPRFFLLRAIIEHFLSCLDGSTTVEWGDIAGSESLDIDLTINLRTRADDSDGKVARCQPLNITLKMPTPGAQK